MRNLSLDLLLIAAVAAVFGRAVTFPLTNWDDIEWIANNSLVRAPFALGLRAWLLTPSMGYPEPITVLSQHLDFRLGGGAPWPFHLTNLLLHAANSVLVRRIASTFSISPFWSLAAALLFAIHPIVAEPVCWATGRKDLIAAFGVLACFLAHRRSLGSERLAPAVLMLGAFAIALGAKPIAVVAPALIAVDCLAQRRRPSIMKIGVLAAMIALSLAAVFQSLRSEAGVGALMEPRGVGATAAFVAQHAALQLRDVLLPFWLSPIYFDPLPAAWHTAWGIAGIAMSVVTAVVLAVAWRSNEPALRLFATWPLIAFAPSAGIIGLVRGPADSYAYLPLVGMALAVAVLAERGVARESRQAMATAFAVIALYGMGGATQASVWRTSSALWQPAVELYPEQPSAHQNLGDALLGEGRPAEALPHLEMAIALLPVPPNESSGIRAVADACFALARYDCAVRWYADLFRRFGSDPGVVFRLLSAFTRDPDPDYAREYHDARGAAVALLKNAANDERALRQLFDGHLRRDTIPEIGLRTLAHDADVGPAATRLLAWYQ